MRYWFIRSPYKTRKWEDVLMSGIFKLYGIRNYAAKKNISGMRKDDKVLWYSSTSGKKIFGTMKIKGTAYQDNTTEDNWLAIDLIPVTTFEKPISYTELKKNVILMNSNIINQTRISVVEITNVEYNEVIRIKEGEKIGSTVDP